MASIEQERRQSLQAAEAITTPKLWYNPQFNSRPTLSATADNELGPAVVVPEKQFLYGKAHYGPEHKDEDWYKVLQDLDTDAKSNEQMGQAYMDRNRAFFVDYLQRFLQQHPEYDGPTVQHRFMELYNSGVPLFERVPSEVEGGHFNPVTDRIVLNRGLLGLKSPKDKDFAHETSHRLRSNLLGSSNFGTEEEGVMADEAYDFITPYGEDEDSNRSERYAVNTELRKKISKDHGGALGEKLDKIIDSLSDSQLIKYLKTLNGYTEDTWISRLIQGEHGVGKVREGKDFIDNGRGDKIRRALKLLAKNDTGREPEGGTSTA